jgi:hypothetical protein
VCVACVLVAAVRGGPLPFLLLRLPLRLTFIVRARHSC